jgi:hypothetical protein
MRIRSFARGYAWVLLAAMLALAPRSFGWNDTGHEIIASIAYSELTPAAQAAAADLLKAHPRFEKDLLPGLPDGVDAHR